LRTSVLCALVMMASIFASLGGAFAHTVEIPWNYNSPAKAGYKACYRAVCLQRAPFTCRGPIGSCGFQQGQCVKYQKPPQTYLVPQGQSCYDQLTTGGPVVK